MRVDGNHGGTSGYEHNVQGEWTEQPEFSELPLSIDILLGIDVSEFSS